MWSKKIFWVCLIIGMMIVTTTLAQAQSSGWRNRAKNGSGSCLAPVAQAQASEAAAGAERQAASPESQVTEQCDLRCVLERQKKVIVGSWFITLGCGCKILASFTSDGIFLSSGQGDIQPAGSPVPSGTSAYGAWTHLGGRQFAVTFLIIGYDVGTGEFRGTLKVRISLTLNEAGDQLSGTDKAEIFDPDGNLVDTFTTGTMHGTRIKVEPLN